MAVNQRIMSVTPDALWRALSDGYAYGYWVVGTREIRDVDDDFPAPGSRLHYSVGYRPFRHTGYTEVVAADPERCLELEIHAWPPVTVRVRIEFRQASPTTTEVVMTEHPCPGPLAALHNPVFDAALKLRNVEGLRRLEQVAKEKAMPSPAEQAV